MKDNEMKKSDLAKAAEISSYTMTKLNKDQPINLEVMMNLCKVFHGDIGDLMEIIEEEEFDNRFENKTFVLTGKLEKYNAILIQCAIIVV